MQVHHAAVSARNLAHVGLPEREAITSCSWSNVAEYMLPADFHQLALSIAPAGVPHFGHFMNWLTDIKGSCVLDYGVWPQSTAADAKRRCQIMVDALQFVQRLMRQTGLAPYVRQVPLDNRMNMSDAFLYQEMHTKWLGAFAATAPASNQLCAEVLHAPGYSDFSRADSVFHVKMQYASKGEQ